jgi:hypothetical protein
MPYRAPRLFTLANKLADLAVEATELGQPGIALQLTQAMREAQQSARALISVPDRQAPAEASGSKAP